MSMVGFPLLLIPLAIYNIIVFLMPGVSLAEPVVNLTLMSGAEWPLTLSDMLLALGIVLLLLEVIKGARPGGKYLTDHLLSLIVFGAAAAEFLLWPRFGSSTYFLLALLALVDFLSGIALRVRRGTQPATAAARRGRLQPVTLRCSPNRIRGSRACGAGSCFSRRIGAAGPSSNSSSGPTRPSRRHGSLAIAGGAVARAAARQRLAAAARRAAALDRAWSVFRVDQSRGSNLLF